MANETKKSLVEEALLQMKNLEEAVTENAKGILASTMKEEISELVKESLSEEDEMIDEVEMEEGSENEEELEMTEQEMELDIEDLEDEMDDMESDDSEMEDEGEEMDMDDVEDMLDMDLPGDELEVDDEEEVLLPLDLTGASDDEILKVFKAMGQEDGIIISQDDDEISLKDNEADVEYKIQMESEEEEEEMTEEVSEEDMDVVVYEIEMDEEMDEEVKEGQGYDDKEDERLGMKHGKIAKKDLDSERARRDDAEFETRESEMYEDYDDMFLSIGDQPWHNRSDRRYDGDFDFEYDEEEIDSFDDLMSKYGEKQNWFAPDMGDEKDLGMSSSGRKMFDMYKEKYGQPFKLRKRRMEGEATEGMVRSHAAGQNASSDKSKGLPRPHSVPNKARLGESAEKEIQQLREKNEEYRKALNIFKEKLNEVAVFNSNLAYATRLFTENTTTKQEKINILRRFDSVETLKESKGLYKTLKEEFESKEANTISESVSEKVSKTPVKGSSANLIESKTYENPQFMRMKDLMSKIIK